MRRLLKLVLTLIVVPILIGAVVAYVLLRRSLPAIDGRVTVAGLTAPVEIVRDADAIPHVFAANKNDALFGLGYVHAQDRLWQMEFQRRIGHGRLSELFGEATVPQDRFLRTVGFGRAARSAWSSTPDWAKRQIDAYVAGVNAFIAAHHGTALPPEFSLLRIEPEPFTGPDVLVWVKMMAWDLSANYAFELLRHDLVRAVGAERMTQLMPEYAADGLSILPNGHVTDEAAPELRTQNSELRTRNGELQTPNGVASLSAAFSVLSSEFSVLSSSRSEGLGSNNWVVDGTMTATGKPLLANDPHLGTRLPSTWYLAHVAGGDFEMIGATLPGAPAVALGRNRFIAWGATNVAADVEDLYRERIDDSGHSVEFRGAKEPITIVPETIAVKGSHAVHVDVRVTRHGPLVSDAINAMSAASKKEPKAPPVEPLALRWTALDVDDTTVLSFLKLNEARNWEEFTGALRDFVVPSQNFVYADVDGHIGYYAPGHIPIRASGDGTRPSDGWTGESEWTGWIPFDELPHLYDPPEHFIVTANNRPAPPSYPYTLGFEWYEPYRAQRVVDLLREETKFTPDDFARIQADTLSLHARALVPILLAHARPTTEIDRRAVGAVRQWNFDATADSAATAIFQAWFLRLAPTLVADDLGPLVTETYQGRFSFVTRFLINTLTSNDASWCDDKTTAAAETCDDAVTKALDEGVVDLSRRLGADIGRWRWDAVHRAVFPHQGLDSLATLRPLLSRSVPTAGDWSSVNIGTVAADQLYEQRLVPGYREIIDLSPANDSRFQDAIGQSGHFLSPHYADALPDWRAVKHRKMRMERAEIERGAIGRLRLLP
ncbi:MAG TPA: penicillin acylase family protein [Vicinamibacterales bacterium]|nr:penicillin acylase family protein [Vicinamibacterales bacterium]